MEHSHIFQTIKNPSIKSTKELLTNFNGICSVTLVLCAVIITMTVLYAVLHKIFKTQQPTSKYLFYALSLFVQTCFLVILRDFSRVFSNLSKNIPPGTSLINKILLMIQDSKSLETEGKIFDYFTLLSTLCFVLCVMFFCLLLLQRRSSKIGKLNQEKFKFIQMAIPLGISVVTAFTCFVIEDLYTREKIAFVFYSFIIFLILQMVLLGVLLYFIRKLISIEDKLKQYMERPMITYGEETEIKVLEQTHHRQVQEEEKNSRAMLYIKQVLVFVIFSSIIIYYKI